MFLLWNMFPLCDHGLTQINHNFQLFQLVKCEKLKDKLNCLIPYAATSICGWLFLRIPGGQGVGVKPTVFFRYLKQFGSEQTTSTSLETWGNKSIENATHSQTLSYTRNCSQGPYFRFVCWETIENFFRKEKLLYRIFMSCQGCR